MVVEAVPVVLLARVVPRPVRALDVGEHDAGIGPLLVVVVPDVPVGLGVVPRRPRLHEPGVLVAGVVHDEVGDHPDAPAVGVLQEGHQVADAPVVGVDVEEVADVVAAVAERRGVEGQHPDAVDAEPLHVVELLAQPAQVAGAVVVGVVVAPDEHLVEDGVLEPADRWIEGALTGADRNGWRAHRVIARRRSPCPGRSRGTTRCRGRRPRSAATATNASRSMSSPVASVVSRPRSTADLARPWARTGPAAQLGRPRERRVEDVVGRHDPVHQPDRQRLLGPDLATGEDELLGPGRPDQAGQALGAAAAGDHAEQDLGQPEAGVLGADTEVAGQRQLQTTAQGVPVDRGDGRPWDGRQRTQRVGEAGADGPCPAVAQLHDVGAGGEDPPAAPEHDRARRVLRQSRWRCRAAAPARRRKARWPSGGPTG